MKATNLFAITVKFWAIFCALSAVTTIMSLWMGSVSLDEGVWLSTYVFMLFSLLVLSYLCLQSRYINSVGNNISFDVMGIMFVAITLFINEFICLADFIETSVSSIKDNSLNSIDILLNGGLGMFIGLVLYAYVKRKY